MKRTLTYLLPPMILLIPSLAIANSNHTVDVPVKSVLVYPSAAQLNYEAEVDIEAGESVVGFTNLSPFIIENTINVSTSGAGVEIISVSERINFLDSGPRNKNGMQSLRDSIGAVENRFERISIRITSYEAERAILFKGESIGGVGNGVSVDEIKRASDFFQERHFELSQKIYNLEKKRERLAGRSLDYKRQMTQVNTVKGRKTSEVRITVKCDRKTSSPFELSYLTNKGGWAPMYDLKYNGVDEDMNFIFRANVFNATGYDWNQVRIQLSTANPTIGFGIPSFDGSQSQTRPNQDGEVEFQTVEVFNAIVEYKISHVYNIASNSKPHLVDVERHTMPSSFRYLVIPKVDPFGFLMAKIPNWNGYNLIPGTTNVYNNGTYMGRTFLDTYAENDTLEVFLGKDKTVQAVRNEENKVKKSPLVGNYYSDASRVSIQVKNNGSAAFDITVMDQVPIMDDLDKTKFNLNGISDALYDKEEGLLTWNISLAPGAQSDVEFKFDIKAPIHMYNSGSQYRRKFRVMQAPKF